MCAVAGKGRVTGYRINRILRHCDEGREPSIVRLLDARHAKLAVSSIGPARLEALNGDASMILAGEKPTVVADDLGFDHELPAETGHLHDSGRAGNVAQNCGGRRFTCLFETGQAQGGKILDGTAEHEREVDRMASDAEKTIGKRHTHAAQRTQSAFVDARLHCAPYWQPMAIVRHHEFHAVRPAGFDHTLRFVEIGRERLLAPNEPQVLAFEQMEQHVAVTVGWCADTGDLRPAVGNHAADVGIEWNVRTACMEGCGVGRCNLDSAADGNAIREPEISADVAPHHLTAGFLVESRSSLTESDNGRSQTVIRGDGWMRHRGSAGGDTRYCRSAALSAITMFVSGKR